MERANSSPACASCKHQRKKCTDKCILAPLFPVEKNREFQAVHRVFGVSNVTKIVKNLPEEDRRSAVESLIWEATCRQRDPVSGPYADYRRMYAENRRIQAENIRIHAEYRRMLEELQFIKNQNQRFHHNVPPHQGLIGWNNNDTRLMNIGGEDNNPLNFIHENGNSIVDSCLYDYTQCDQDQIVEKVSRESKDNLPPQQHSANGFNNSYCLGGPYYLTDAKSTENSLWRGSS